MTKKLYYDDPFLREFTARVLSCEAVKGGFAVVLDETAFYPEGGGQSADHGALGTVRVLDVHEKDGVITHLCDGALEPGAVVCGEIDWARRFDHMQQHSGEHICSGLICVRFDCDNVGFHMGADVVTIDFNAEIGWDALMEIEARANEYIYEDDREMFCKAFGRENVMRKIAESGEYKLQYRMIIKNKPVDVKMRAVPVSDKEGDRLIVGVTKAKKS